MQIIHYCTKIFEKHQSLPICLAIGTEILKSIEQSLQCQKLFLSESYHVTFGQHSVYRYE